MSKPVTFNISSGAILKVVFVLLLLGFAWVIRDIIAILFVSLVLAAAIHPAVVFFGRWKIPAWMSVLLVYIVLIGLFSLAVGLLVPVFSEQIGGLASEFPLYYEKFQQGVAEIQNYSAQYELSEEIKKLIGPLGRAGQGIVTSVFGLFGGFVSILVVLVLTFYLSVERNGLEHAVRLLAPERYHEYLLQLMDRMQKRVGLWVRGQFILMLSVGLLVFIGLLILRVPYAALLAFIAFILEIIPIAGPLLSAVVAVALTFLATQSLFKTLLVILLFFIVQQLENQILTPKIMSKVVGLSPLVVIVAILIGAKTAGVVGALLAVPVATALSVFISDLRELRREVPKT